MLQKHTYIHILFPTQLYKVARTTMLGRLQGYNGTYKKINTKLTKLTIQLSDPMQSEEKVITSPTKALHVTDPAINVCRQHSIFITARKNTHRRKVVLQKRAKLSWSASFITPIRRYCNPSRFFVCLLVRSLFVR